MSDHALPDEKRMRLRYAGTCRLCGLGLPAKADAIYERVTKTVRCVDHEVGSDVATEVAEEVVDPGTPGASARREFERRSTAREQRVRARHPKLGGLILGLD